MKLKFQNRPLLNWLRRVTFTTISAVVCTIGVSGDAMAQKLTSPVTPTDITPPAGTSVYLMGSAVGTQGYVC